MDSLRKHYEALDNLRQENQDGLKSIIIMKDQRLSYQEARIEALEREVEKLNIEIINLQIKNQYLEDAINR